MDTEELKERYKMLPIWARLLIALFVGALPGAYIYFDEGDALASEQEQTAQEEEAAQAKLDRSIAKKKKIPEIEERLAELEEQMAKARKALPPSFRIEDVLQKMATIAKETGVTLALFNPEQEKPGSGNYKYMEMPIATEVSGKFNQLTAFIDRVVHLEHSLFVRNIEMTPEVTEDFKDDLNKSVHQRAKDVRQSLYAKSKFQLVVYRSMTDAEAARNVGGGDGEPAGRDKSKADDKSNADDKSDAGEHAKGGEG